VLACASHRRRDGDHGRARLRSPRDLGSRFSSYQQNRLRWVVVTVHEPGCRVVTSRMRTAEAIASPFSDGATTLGTTTSVAVDLVLQPGRFRSRLAAWLIRVQQRPLCRRAGATQSASSHCPRWRGTGVFAHRRLQRRHVQEGRRETFQPRSRIKVMRLVCATAGERSGRLGGFALANRILEMTLEARNDAGFERTRTD